MSKLQIWFNTYKVLIFGFLAAVALPVLELFQEGEVSVKVGIYAAITAALAWAGRNLRGQWVTIIGILTSAFLMFTGQEENGSVEWRKIISFMLIQLMTLFVPPAKSLGYERTPVIKEAKAEGEQNIPTSAKP